MHRLARRPMLRVNPLAAKLKQFALLRSEDLAALDRLAAEAPLQTAARQEVLREGDVPRRLYLVLTGWLARLRQLEDGRRQICGFLLPGDIFDYPAPTVRPSDHLVASLTPASLAQFTPAMLQAVETASPAIREALQSDLRVNAAIQREWIVSLGQRNALERVGHLFCECYLRLARIGQMQGGSIDFPLKQWELGEATGLSAVHVNRTLQDLRAAGLITLKAGSLTINDVPALQRLSHFDPEYLQIPPDVLRPMPREASRERQLPW